MPTELWKPTFKRDFTLCTIYLWVGIFILQPHKEERFMYVIYPMICYNAAYSIESLTQIFNKLFLGKVRGSILRVTTNGLQTVILVLYAILSLARILAQLRAYAAPMQVYNNLESPSNICLGKEWYRFPSSFFIPENSQALLVKSAFDGLLPGKFHDSDDSGWRSATWQIPSGMNDQNLEEISHLVRSKIKTLLTKGSNCRV
jgi:alpha-1,2-mannosyltransferase